MTTESVNSKKVIESGFWYTIANVLIKAMAIITAPIYTGMLSTAQYGKANTFNSWIDIFHVLTCLCVVYSIGRAKIDFKDQFDEFLSALQGLSSSFGFCILLIAFLFRNQLSAWMQYEVFFVIILFVYLCINPSVEYMMQKCRYQYKYKESVVISLVISISQIFFSISLMLLFKEQPYIGKILGVLLPGFVLGVIFYIRFLAVGKVFYKKEYWIYALKIGVPMIPHALAVILLAQMDRIMIKDLCSDAEAGLYTFGYTYATLLLIVTNAIGQAWLPWFNETLFAGNREKIRQVQKKLVLFGCLLSILFIVVAPEAIKILSFKSPSYWDAKMIIPPVVLGTLAQFFYTNYVNLELYCKKTYMIAIGTCVAAFLNFSLNAWLIPMYGYKVAAYTTFLSYLVLFILHYFITRWGLKEQVYDDPYMFISMVVVSFVGIGFMQLYKDEILFIFIRYFVAFLLLSFLAIVKRSDIIKFINDLKNVGVKNEST